MSHRRDFNLSVFLNREHYFLFLLLQLPLTILPAIASDIDHDINIENTPSWVTIHKLNRVKDIPIDKVRNGIFYQMLDNQILITKDGEKSSYSRYVEKITNKTGLDSASQINLEFDPSYQKVILNSLFVIRNGQRINRLSSARMSLINRETDLEQQIYNGAITLNILISDLQVGDTLDYSYSRHGSNPVYKNIFSYSKNLNWGVPVYDQYLRILWGKSKPLFTKIRNSKLTITKKKKNGFTEFSTHIHNAPVVKTASQMPSWFSPFGRVAFSETEQWSDVINWAMPLYEITTTHPDIQKIADKIKLAEKKQSRQIIAALKYTKEHIRYVGLEMGKNSQLPTVTQVTQTLQVYLFVVSLKVEGTHHLL